MNYRGRIAPSPTGLLHLGHAATFWTAAQRAAEASGTLVLRIEDLDPQRSKPQFAEAAIQDLRWLGIAWQEGPDAGGPFAPYAQSERQPLYEAALQQLIAGGGVYPCRCTRKDLAQMAQAPHDDEPVYPGTCRPEACGSGSSRPETYGSGTSGSGTSCYVGQPSPALPLDAASTRNNWRFRVPDGEPVEFHDGNFGSQRFVAGEDFGDFLVWRKDGVPAYQLAVAVDDAAMQITEVVRGADLLKSTARQILVCRALGLPEPAWFHCPLIADENGERLAKRHDALSLRAMRGSGIKPEEMLRTAIPVGAGGFSLRK